MKIATFNINGIRTRLENLLTWLAHAEPDVVALQEIMCADADFPQAALQQAGYGAIWGDKDHITASPCSHAVACP